jgi:hypothetical protein
LPEKKIAAWIPSDVGLGLEQPWTFSQSPRDWHIFMSTWAPNLLRLSALTGDPTFRIAARNATIGRFTNYPGYYINRYSDLYESAQYPYKGPDITTIYYHHIPPLAAYILDYLFTDAETRSDGKVKFPSVRQDGYVWFDNRMYGYAPGEVYGEQAWPWISRTAVKLNNKNIDYVLAHNDHSLYVVMINQVNEPQHVNLKFDSALLGDSLSNEAVRTWRENKQVASLFLHQGEINIQLPAAGIVALALDGVKNDVATHHIVPPATLDLPQKDPIERQAIPNSDLSAIGTLIAAPPFKSRNLYVYVAASDKQCSGAELTYSIGDGSVEHASVNRFPCEFTVQIDNMTSQVRWRVTKVMQ